jgi:hypothetical protein
MSIESQETESRWGTRVNLDLAVGIATLAGSPAIGVLRNASLSGAYLQTSTRLPLSSRICISTQARLCGSLAAWIVRTDSGGAGLRWLQPDIRAITALLSLNFDPLLARPSQEFAHFPHRATFVAAEPATLRSRIVAQELHQHRRHHANSFTSAGHRDGCLFRHRF